MLQATIRILKMYLCFVFLLLLVAVTESSLTFCDRMDCSNRGTCVGTKVVPLCFCEAGSLGAKCETSTQLSGGGDWLANLFGGNTQHSATATCTAADCSGSGVCVGLKAAPICLCHLGFMGAKCEIPATGLLNTDIAGSGVPCTASDCSHKGVCIGTKGSYVCMCNLGYTGSRCETTPYPLCDASDCNNNGLCLGTKNSYFCACHIGYSGKRCETISGVVCDVNDCNQAGICIGVKSLHICLCNLGYMGDKCQTRLGMNLLPGNGLNGLSSLSNPFCEISDCSGNGLCVGSKLMPTCLCNLGFSGFRCELEPLCNSAIQCSGNGLCLGTGKSYNCFCNFGWTGINCNLPSGNGLLGRRKRRITIRE